MFKKIKIIKGCIVAWKYGAVPIKSAVRIYSIFSRGPAVIISCHDDAYLRALLHLWSIRISFDQSFVMFVPNHIFGFNKEL